MRFGVGIREKSPWAAELRALHPKARPEGSAAEAVGIRILSGAIEPFREFVAAAQEVVKAGPILSTFLLDVDQSDGGPFLLHWASDVDAILAPVPDAAAERAYLTFEDDYPRYTNLTLATDPMYETTAGAYPYVAPRLGLPVPLAAPVVTVTLNEAAEDEVPLDNPGAESGTTGWTSIVGTLESRENGDIVGFDAYEGTNFFYGGASATVEAYQSFLLTDYSLFPGQVMALSWRQAQGGNSSTAAMGLVFLDASSVEIGENTASLYAPAVAFDWELREVTGVVIPDNTVTVRVVQHMVRVGGGDNDAGIDSVVLGVSDATLTLDGTTLDGWEQTVPANASITIAYAANGRPAPSIRLGTKNSDPPSFYRDVKGNESPLYTVITEYFCDSNSAGANANQTIVLDADAAGSGYQLRFASTGMYFERIATWTTSQVTSERLNTVDYADKWYRSTVTVQSSAGKKLVTVVTMNLDSGVDLGTVTAEYTPDGGYVGFRAINNSNDTRYGVIDNIQLQVSPAPVTGEQSRTFTNYISVFINPEGERSAPSDPSIDIEFLETSVIRIVPILTVDGSYDTTGWSVEIYRGATVGDVTGYFLADTATLADLLAMDPEGFFIDTTPDEELGDELESDGWDPPPADGRGIVVAGNNVCAMFSPADKQVCFSPPGAPHAAPELWRATVDYPPVGLAAMDDYVFCFTLSGPYLFSVADPSTASENRRKFEPMPCRSKRGIAIFPGRGVVYPSNDGPAFANANKVELIGLPALDDKAWQALAPDSMLGIQYQGLYYVWYDTGTEQDGIVFDPFQPTAGVARLGWHATAAEINPKTGRLHVVVDDESLIWDVGETLRPWRWRSSDEQMRVEDSWSIIQVIGDHDEVSPLTMRLYYDDVMILEEEITSNEEFNLPDEVAYLSRAIEFEGSTTLETVIAASSLEEF